MQWVSIFLLSLSSLYLTLVSFPENMASEKGSGLELHEDYPDIIVVICMLALFSIFGTIGNAFVLFVYSRKKEKTTTTIFILTLAGTDFFTCLVIVPFTIVVEYVAKRIQYDSVCKIYQFLITSNVPFSAFIMVIIAFDRYLKICRPWNHTLDSKMAKRIIIFLFMLAVVLGVITSLAHGVPNFVTINANESLLSINETTVTTNSSFPHIYGSRERMYNNLYSTPLAPAPNNQSKSDYYHNTTQLTTIDGFEDKNTISSKYNGFCVPNDIYISIKIRNVFQKCYASLFLMSFILVVILYSLILRSLVVRRARKAKKTYVSENCTGHNTTNHLLPPTTCTFATKSTMTDNYEVTSFHIPTHDGKEPLRLERSQSIRNKLCSANIKTAGILFIVTVVFIVAFLPAWLMAMRTIGGNIIVFYMHFSYNVANPIIYAFFNANFRREIKRDCSLFISYENQTNK